MKGTIGLIAVTALLLGATGAGAAALIDGGDVKNSSLTGKDVKNKSLTRLDFRGSVRGPRGFQGPQGAQGPAGPTAVGQIAVVRSPQVAYGPSDFVQTAIAFCPAGQRVISGGGVNIGDEQLAMTEALGDRSGWAVIGVDRVDDGGEYIQAQALCAPTGQAVAARRSTARAEVAAKARQIERTMGATKG
jgi:hypothetical protein